MAGVWETSCFQIATFREVVENARFVHGSPIPAQDDLSTHQRQLLFPFMNFTCTSTLTSLTFIARVESSGPDRDGNGITSWPSFSLWHQSGIDNFMNMGKIGPSGPDQLTICPSEKDSDVRLVRVTLTATFEAGDIIGLQQQNSPLHETINQGATVTVVRQRGYGLIWVCDERNIICAVRVPGWRSIQQIPYIAAGEHTFMLMAMLDLNQKGTTMHTQINVHPMLRSITSEVVKALELAASSNHSVTLGMIIVVLSPSLIHNCVLPIARGPL